MPKSIRELTPAQAAAMPAWRDLWISIGLSCAPMEHGDRFEVDRAIRDMYRRAKLKEPSSVVFVPSPFVLKVAAGIAGGAIYAARHGWPVRSAVGSAVG